MTEPEAVYLATTEEWLIRTVQAAFPTARHQVYPVAGYLPPDPVPGALLVIDLALPDAHSLGRQAFTAALSRRPPCRCLALSRLGVPAVLPPELRSRVQVLRKERDPELLSFNLRAAVVLAPPTPPALAVPTDGMLAIDLTDRLV
jgi:hypothetical protein